MVVVGADGDEFPGELRVGAGKDRHNVAGGLRPGGLPLARPLTGERPGPDLERLPERLPVAGRLETVLLQDPDDVLGGVFAAGLAGGAPLAPRSGQVEDVGPPAPGGDRLDGGLLDLLQVRHVRDREGRRGEENRQEQQAEDRVCSDHRPEC